MHKLQRAVADYEAVVATTALKSILDAESTSSSRTGNSSTRIPELSRLKKTLSDDFGIDLDVMLRRPAYNEDLLRNRLDNIVQSFRRVKSQARTVAGFLSLPSPKSVIRMSKFRERAWSLRYATRGGMMADDGGTEMDPGQEPDVWSEDDSEGAADDSDDSNGSGGASDSD